MRVQLDRFREAIVGGMPRVGWKIGINDPRVLARLGLAAPVVGWLAGDRVVRSGGRFVPPPHARVAVEAEVAVRVGGGGAVAALAPALELVNYSQPANTLEQVLAHDMFHDGVVLGREALPVPIVDAEWPHVLRNGEVVAERDPSLLRFQPTAAVRHVADVLARHLERLDTGDWIISGSLTPAVPVAIGDRIEADFGPLGRVSVTIGS
jgi:2-keto-4-pentenoate hydratase